MIDRLVEYLHEYEDVCAGMQETNNQLNTRSIGGEFQCMSKAKLLNVLFFFALYDL